MMRALKQSFYSGLALILPMVLTFMVLHFFLRILTEPFVGALHWMLTKMGWEHGHFLFIPREVWIHYTSQILILTALFCLTLLTGYLARLVVVRAFMKGSDWLFHRIPLMNRLYKATKETVKALFTSQSKSFQQAVLVPFPGEGSYTLGLVTHDALPSDSDSDLQTRVPVLIPGAPSLLHGFLLFYRLEQIIVLPITVEEALKSVVSGGMDLLKKEEVP